MNELIKRLNKITTEATADAKARIDAARKAAPVTPIPADKVFFHYILVRVDEQGVPCNLVLGANLETIQRISRQIRMGNMGRLVIMKFNGSQYEEEEMPK